MKDQVQIRSATERNRNPDFNDPQSDDTISIVYIVEQDEPDDRLTVVDHRAPDHQHQYEQHQEHRGDEEPVLVRRSYIAHSHQSTPSYQGISIGLDAYQTGLMYPGFQW